MKPKAAARKKYRLVRLGMSRDEVQAESRRIGARLLAEIDWRKIQNLLAYRPIDKLNEVVIQPFLDELKISYPQIKVEFVGAAPDQPLPKKPYDVILVPTLAFDKGNYRLGWGGGFYDRLLAAQPKAYKVGLCFQNGYIAGGFVHESHDIRLDKIVTGL